MGKWTRVIRAWIQKNWGTGAQANAAPVPRAVTSPAGTVPEKYRALNKYLTERYADAVTLTFGQIEDVLGSALPPVARTQHDWWTMSATSGEHAQSNAWTLAGRTAQPNIGAQTVLFERDLSL